MTEKQLRHALRLVGRRRKAQQIKDRKLQEDTTALLQKARGKIPTTEAAQLVGLTRSTVYEVYAGGRKT